MLRFFQALMLLMFVGCGVKGAPTPLYPSFPIPQRVKSDPPASADAAKGITGSSGVSGVTAPTGQSLSNPSPSTKKKSGR